MKFRTGNRILQLSDQSNPNIEASQTSAEGVFVSSGILNTLQETIMTTRTIDLVTQTVSDDRIISESSVLSSTSTEATTRTTTSTTRNFNWGDPIAQTFMIEDRGGCFITKIDLFFSTKDDVLPITLQIREVINGYPGSKVLPFSEVTLKPISINTSEDASVVTTFKFSSPVYLMPSEYCFVLLSDSVNYNVWISRLGELAIGTNRMISEQPYLGVMFKSQNSSTWSAFQDEDIKFTLYKAKFDTESTAHCVFNNKTLPSSLLTVNPIRYTEGESTVRIVHYNHGMCVNGRVTLSGVDDAYDINDADINKTHIITNIVDHHTYEIDTGTNAVVFASVNINEVYGGGNTVVASHDVMFDVINTFVQNLIFTDTDISWFTKATSANNVSGEFTPFVADSDYYPIIEGENTIFNSPKAVYSGINETTHLAGSKSFFVKASLTTNNEDLSPVIDLDRTSSIAIHNIINNDSSNETDPVGGLAEAKYVSKNITLAESATAIRIMFAAVLFSNITDIDVYYKVLPVDVNTSIDEIDFTLVDTDTPLLSASLHDNDWKDLEYTINDLTEYTSIVVKLVLRGSNSAMIPKVKDLRIICLGA